MSLLRRRASTILHLPLIGLRARLNDGSKRLDGVSNRLILGKEEDNQMGTSFHYQGFA